MRAADLVADWAGRGAIQRVGDDEVFVVAAGDPLGAGPPLLVLHGYPTSSIDYAAVLPALGAGRRVVLFDFPGFGCSAKPDRAYSLFGQADVAASVVAALGIDEVDLLTHDMGDSIGGELLARGLEGTLGFDIRRRVLTNGSIYLELAQLTDGQQFLAALPDEAIAEDDAPDVDALTQALTATLASPGSDNSKPDPEHVRAAALLIVQSGGNRLLARQIRYIEERRQHEARWAHAIETHPAPLAIVWGDADPIAVWAMTDRLLERRPDANRVRLARVGHYPMVEAPQAFATAVLAHL